MIPPFEEVIEKIIGLYEKYGHEDYIGAPVSQLEHMSQSAELAMKEGYDDEVVLTAFFHDIGHLCVPLEPDNNMEGLASGVMKRSGQISSAPMGFMKRLLPLQ